MSSTLNSKDILNLIQELIATQDNTLKRMNEFESKWEILVENLVEGGLTKRLKEFGIAVHSTSERKRAKSDTGETTHEFDIIVKNTTEVVVVEVKTTLEVEDVKEFIENLEQFKEIFPEYSEKKVYGAVAYLTANAKSDKFAMKQKLFAIKAINDSSKIINEKSFKPKAF